MEDESNRAPFRSRGLWAWATSAIAYLPGIAWAMQKCPEEFGPKPVWFMPLGWAVLGVFLIAGAGLPWLVWRLSKTAGALRGLWFALTLLIAMPAVWFAGFVVFAVVFALAC